MVREDIDSVPTTLKVVAPNSETMDNCEEFLISRGVAGLSGREFLRPEGYGVPNTVVVLLGKNTSHTPLRSVSFEADRAAWVEMAENRCRLEGEKEALESVKGFFIENEPSGLLAIFAALREVGKRANDIGVVVDEAAVEIAKPKENLNVSVASGDGPPLDGFDPTRIH